VTNLYEGFLQRGPDATGLSFWTGQAATTAASRQNVLNAFATCPPARELAGTLYSEAFWLVTDHLGTPRMVVDKSGSLAGVKRHDYLPFGEELGAGVGGRTATQGYNPVDNVRQKFTGYERDTETNLDYAQARYYASAQGRFTGVDPLTASARAASPQTWNRYSYGVNNPLRYADPTGMDANDAQQKQEPPPPPPPLPTAPSIPPISNALAGSPAFVQQHPIAAGIQIYVPVTGFVSNEYFQGGYNTGVESVAEITVVDGRGVPINEPFWVKEDVDAQLSVNNQVMAAPVRQNPDVVFTENGFPDNINITKSTAARLPQAEVDAAQDTLARNHFKNSQTQALTIMTPGRGVVLTVVNERTQENRAALVTDQRGILVPNYSTNVSIKSITPSVVGSP
jgi:RHS repeat-associated protein